MAFIRSHIDELEKNKVGEGAAGSEHRLSFSGDLFFLPLFSGDPLSLQPNMTTSRRLADRKVEKFEKNITKRGFVPETTAKKGKDYPVGPVLLGFFVFVVIGSSLFQIIRTATSGGMA
uniref:Stress-associated endoplasmic reticulum protein 2 n=2 Tax=Phaseoleae TaxID=163735 RepID=A0A151SDR2_CAJCA|nr:Stress-associated endoplasmic reticulum protein 2 [Cajanus cajan]